MNKQELIDYCNAIKENKSQIINCIDVNGIIKKIEQLDEPQKVVIPQFVADWIETAKKVTYNIRGAIEMAPKGRIENWLELKNVNTFAEAWVNGYEVEKEKRYMVKMKGLSECYNYLNYDSLDDEWYFTDAENGSAVGTHHTRKKFEDAGFGEVFNSPLFEVEEVEE